MRNVFFGAVIFSLALCSPALATNSEKTTDSAGLTSVSMAETDQLQDKVASPNGGWSPAFSPDGRRVAFLSATLHTPADLWVMNADGSEARRLTTRGVQSFSWSEDGTTIRLKTVRKSFEEVLSIGLDGTKEKRIQGLPTGSSFPHYSPDGSLFAITAPGEQNTIDLWIGTADGKRLEAITEKIGIRSIFWHPDSRKIYYEAGGQSYGVGIWEIDLSTMQSKSLLDNYIGTPVYSSQAGMMAYAYPTNPGEFDVQTMKLDGSGIKSHPSPRLPGKRLVWNREGTGVYYLGQDIEEIVAEEEEKGIIAGIINSFLGFFSGDSQKESKAVDSSEEKDAGENATDDDLEEAPPLHNKEGKKFRRIGSAALWYLDLATGAERKISPPALHLINFTLSPDGKKVILAGLLADSYNTELFSLDPVTADLIRLTRSRVSSWLPTPSQDSAKIAFFTNKGGIGNLKIASPQGQELASYPGIAQEGDTRVFWLPESEGLLIYSSRGLLAFTEEKGAIAFPSKKDHRAFLGADVSIQEDKVLLNTVPRYGQTPGLYMLEAIDGTFVQTDLRFPSVVGEYAAEMYMQPRWSLDGKKIAFADRIDIWTMNADGTGRKWLTKYLQANKDEKNTPALASYPIWSSQGEMLSFTLTVYEKNSIHRQLWVMKADGTDRRMLYSQALDSQFQMYLPEYTNLPFFDYDDRQIIFTAHDDGVPNIYAVDVKDGVLHKLTESGAIFPALLPEEGVILYTSLAGNNEQLMAMNSDGTEKHLFVVKEKSKE